MELIRKVEEAIRRGELLHPGMRVACACSGGADSVALVQLLEELKSELGLRLLVVHLNHQLRGAEADADEGFVRRLAERLELEFVVRREDVAARARRELVNLEEAGRQARLDFFATLVAAGKADAVALAHTMDDQAETVLARLLRGAGTRGLAGIYPLVEPLAGQRGGRLVRPLLGVRRAELRQYLSERELGWREDASNLDRDRLRNRVRLEVLPQLACLAGPGVVEHLARLAEYARQEESFWAAYIDARWRGLTARRLEKVEFPVATLLAGDPLLATLPARVAREAQRAVARRLLRRAVGEARGDLRRVSATHIEAVLRLAESGQSGQRVDLPGARVERRFDTLVFSPARLYRGSGRPPDFELQVEAPGPVRLPGDAALEFKLVAVAELEPGYNRRSRVVDAAQAPFPLRVRNWRPGDSYQPAGVRRRIKLKTLFERERIPRAERGRTPVVLRGGDIVWVARLGAAAGYALGERSRTALLIEEGAEA
jgi:tRNA(Ile)-lysidine synthase